MSQFPNPGQPGSAPNPFAPAPAYQQPPKSSKVWLWILLGVGGLGLLMCCGCGGLFMFGMNLASRPLIAQLNNDATAQQHLGTVSSASMDIMATGEATQKAGGDKLIVFQVKGDKGSGMVRAKQNPANGSFENAVLILPGGQEVPLGF